MSEVIDGLFVDMRRINKYNKETNFLYRGNTIEAINNNYCILRVFRMFYKTSARHSTNTRGNKSGRIERERRRKAMEDTVYKELQRNNL